MESIESLVKGMKNRPSPRIRESLLDFGAAYGRFKSSSRARLLCMTLSWAKSLKVFENLEAELNGFQEIIDSFPNAEDPAVASLDDANRARLAVMAAHRAQSELAMRRFYSDHARDHASAYKLAASAVAVHVDWLRSLASARFDKAQSESRRRKVEGSSLALEALAVVVNEGYAIQLLDFFMALWSERLGSKKHTRRLALEEKRCQDKTSALSSSSEEEDISEDSDDPTPSRLAKKSRALAALSSETCIFPLAPTALGYRRPSLVLKRTAKMRLLKSHFSSPTSVHQKKKTTTYTCQLASTGWRPASP